MLYKFKIKDRVFVLKNFFDLNLVRSTGTIYHIVNNELYWVIHDKTELGEIKCRQRVIIKKYSKYEIESLLIHNLKNL